MASALLGRRCWLPGGANRKTYPNIYAVVVGNSARVKKTTAIGASVDLYQKIDQNTLFAKNISTSQGLIELLRLPTEAEIKEYASADSLEEEAPRKFSLYGLLRNQGRFGYEGFRLFYFHEEFASLLMKLERDYSNDFLETLKKAYDMPDTLENKTMLNPISARYPCVSVVSAITKHQLTKRLKEEEVFSGFANRFLYITGSRKPPIAWTPIPDEDRLSELSIKMYQQISRWDNDRFKPTEKARKLFSDWYEDWYYTELSEVLATVLGRHDEHIKKTMLVYAALENSEPIITPEQMETGLAVGDFYKKCTEEVFSTYGQSGRNKKEEEILDVLKENRDGLTQSEIREKTGQSFGMLQDNLRTLLSAGVIHKKKVSYKDSAGRERTKEVYCRSWVG